MEITLANKEVLETLARRCPICMSMCTKKVCSSVGLQYFICNDCGTMYNENQLRSYNKVLYKMLKEE